MITVSIQTTELPKLQSLVILHLYISMIHDTSTFVDNALLLDSEIPPGAIITHAVRKTLWKEIHGPEPFTLRVQGYVPWSDGVNPISTQRT
jgi:hypothetical protein